MRLPAAAARLFPIFLRRNDNGKLENPNPIGVSGYGVVLSSPRRQVRFPAVAAAFLKKAKSKNARVYDISAYIKDPEEVKINPELSTMGA